MSSQHDAVSPPQRLGHGTTLRVRGGVGTFAEVLTLTARGEWSTLFWRTRDAAVAECRGRAQLARIAELKAKCEAESFEWAAKFIERWPS